jgi:parvulin-like peptidyl-prolyl isomerase
VLALVVKGVKPTAAEVRASYQENISSYETPASRAVEEILVGKNKESLAEQIVAKLKAGATFAALAKQYSQDPGSKDSGGKFTAQQGKDVPQFDAAVFATSSKTDELLAPVNTSEYGWFVIEPLGPIKPASVEPEAKAAPTIVKSLTETDDDTAINSWYAGLEKTVCNAGSVTFATGYTPSPNPCSTLTATNQTTT